MHPAIKLYILLNNLGSLQIVIRYLPADTIFQNEPIEWYQML